MKTRKKQQSFSKARARRLTFSERVYKVVAAIPPGNTMSYKQVAAKAGNPGAARAVGTLMSKNYDPNIPCHRVIRSDGKIGNYNRGGPSRKVELLLEEAYRT